MVEGEVGWVPIWPIGGGEALGYEFGVEARYLLRRSVDEVPFACAAEALAAKAS